MGRSPKAKQTYVGFFKYSGIYVFPASTKKEAGGLLTKRLKADRQEHSTPGVMPTLTAPLFYCPVAQCLWFKLTSWAHPCALYPCQVPAEQWDAIKIKEAPTPPTTNGAISTYEIRKANVLEISLVDFQARRSAATSSTSKLAPN